LEGVVLHEQQLDHPRARRRVELASKRRVANARAAGGQEGLLDERFVTFL